MYFLWHQLGVTTMPFCSFAHMVKEQSLYCLYSMLEELVMTSDSAASCLRWTNSTQALAIRMCSWTRTCWLGATEITISVQNEYVTKQLERKTSWKRFTWLTPVINYQLMFKSNGSVIQTSYLLWWHLHVKRLWIHVSEYRRKLLFKKLTARYGCAIST